MPKLFKVLALTLFAALALSLWLSPPTTGQNKKGNDGVDSETGSGSVSIMAPTEALTTDMDAKTDDLFNNFGARGTPIDECVADAVPPTARGNGRFEDNKFIFEEEETVADGLGPTYNDVGCVTCHQAVDTGAFGQQMEFRAGHLSGSTFVDNPGGQLIHTRGTDSDIVEHITTAETVRSFRVVTQALGDGFIECVSNTDLQNNVAAEPSAQRGRVDVARRSRLSALCRADGEDRDEGTCGRPVALCRQTFRRGARRRADRRGTEDASRADRSRAARTAGRGVLGG